jgi:hypothetical protein
MDSRRRVPAKAVEMMNEYSAWLTTMPVPEDEVIRFLVSSTQRQGLIYTSGRTKKFNPIMVVNVRRIIDSKIDMEALLRLSYFVFNWVIQNMIVLGKVETWVIIQDLKDVGASQIPVKMLKKMSERLSIYYTQRLLRSFSINVPTAISMLWSVVKVFIEEETRHKIVIMKNGWQETLAECIDLENLEQKYGGTRPNREHDFYPFT